MLKLEVLPAVGKGAVMNDRFGKRHVVRAPLSEGYDGGGGGGGGNPGLAGGPSAETVGEYWICPNGHKRSFPTPQAKPVCDCGADLQPDPDH